jgi:hypothetical protein
MFYHNRRDFIKTSGSILGAALLGELMFGCRQENIPGSSKHQGFKYAMCNESMAQLSWAEQCRIVASAGYRGIEIAAFTLITEDVQELTAAKRKEMVSTMINAGIECAGLHWLLSPPPKGLHFTTSNAAVRRKTIAYLDKLIDFCGDLGAPPSKKQRNILLKVLPGLLTMLRNVALKYLSSPWAKA